MSQATLELILVELRNFREEVNDEFKGVRQEIQDVRSELKAEIQSEVRSLRSEIQDVRTELLQEIAAIKKEQKAIHKRLDSIEDLYAQLVGLIKSLRVQVADLAEKQSEQEQRCSFQLHSHEASLQVLHREQLALKTEIELLKSRI